VCSARRSNGLTKRCNQLLAPDDQPTPRFTKAARVKIIAASIYYELISPAINLAGIFVLTIQLRLRQWEHELTNNRTPRVECDFRPRCHWAPAAFDQACPSNSWQPPFPDVGKHRDANRCSHSQHLDVATLESKKHPVVIFSVMLSQPQSAMPLTTPKFYSRSSRR
jgi:hypothetical protein